MRRTETYHFLRALVADIETREKASLSFAVFDAAKIQRFRQQNTLRINSMNQKILELVDLHVAKDEKDQPQVDENNTWVFTSDEAKAAYKEAYGIFMNKHIDIFL